MSSIETLPAPDLSAPHGDKWRREQLAFRQLLPELLHTHLDKFVAIHEGRVVDSGNDKLELARRAYEQFGYIPIFISRVVTGPPRPSASRRRVASTGRWHDPLCIQSPDRSARAVRPCLAPSTWRWTFN